ncbi:putative transcriptional regulator, AsnC family [Methanosalsum zhilinae DSM 4017]|uniref:siroheme decarboxylase n=1 Tax=Methanosalsum zhilinae (strain DSM 4017 / NBRC 107636 / OCM 62 / WeN5) TaxID=679901 RepID=F7XP38_METZD|nr:AsnC family transcriptional regulator [Methanosalsum zhilinae]AEH61330.1 putative transcriptional regulator, AsnC family [Methanosalsum zhilinae DSM 4017]
MIPLDETDKDILNAIQFGFPMDVKPFEKLGERLEIKEEEVLRRIRRLNKAGAIRRIGPIINTKQLGGVSTLAAVSVPEANIDKAAEYINQYPEVSHNYLRPDKYNIWFTVSADDENRLNEILEDIEKETDCPLINLPTVRLFKIGVMFNIR